MVYTKHTMSSMPHKPQSNNYAFIDSQNLHLSIKDQGWRLDLVKFRTYLTAKYKVTKAFLFLGFIDENQEMYTRLQQHGYILVFKPTLKLPDGKVKGNVDAELVLHAMVELPNYDKAIIVSNDGDFHCLVEYLFENDRLERLLVPNQKNYSSLLRKFMPKIHFMNQLKKKLALDTKKERH